MGKIAIDVVLLPSEEMMDKAIAANKQLISNNAKIILNKDNCIPHISLCMGNIEEDKIDSITDILAEISQTFSHLELHANLTSSTISTGEILSSFKIENQKSLQELHETIMKKLWSYLSYDVETTTSFYDPSQIEEITLKWLKDYAKKYVNPLSFHPHITIGIGEVNSFQAPITFKSSRLALCHLGNYCTCRKILYSTNLS